MFKMLKVVLLAFLATFLGVKAEGDEIQKEELTWDRAEIWIHNGLDMEDDLGEMFTSQHQIKWKVRNEVEIPELHMFVKGQEKSQEVMFPTLVPVWEVVKTLKEKNLFQEGHDEL